MAYSPQLDDDVLSSPSLLPPRSGPDVKSSSSSPASIELSSNWAGQRGAADVLSPPMTASSAAVAGSGQAWGSGGGDGAWRCKSSRRGELPGTGCGTERGLQPPSNSFTAVKKASSVAQVWRLRSRSPPRGLCRSGGLGSGCADATSSIVVTPTAKRLCVARDQAWSGRGELSRTDASCAALLFQFFGGEFLASYLRDKSLCKGTRAHTLSPSRHHTVEVEA